jgi:FKBP-type peptidyl-prolyl cis-trans isomerase
MYRLVASLLVLAVFPQLAFGQQEAEEKKEAPDPLHPRVKMETSLGDIILELDADKAPITVDNFLQYAKDGFYNGTIFHRVISDFMIQGGGFTAEMEKKTEGIREPIKNEWKNGLKNERGTIAMARSRAPDSATAQFFINVVDNTRGSKRDLDTPRAGAAYAVFGKVVEGLDVVDRIRDTELIKHPKYQSPERTRPQDPPVTPKESIIIKSVTLLEGLTYDQVAAAVKPVMEAAAKAEAEAQAKARAEAEVRAKSFAELLAKGADEHGNKLQKTASGLMYVILKEGEGATPQPTDTVQVHYTGWLSADGTKFDSSYDRGTPATCPLNRVIKGWTEGVGLMKVGAKHRLVIPPELAYGERGRPSIPPNSTLVFDIELLGIK